MVSGDVMFVFFATIVILVMMSVYNSLTLSSDLMTSNAIMEHMYHCVCVCVCVSVNRSTSINAHNVCMYTCIPMIPTYLRTILVL